MANTTVTGVGTVLNVSCPLGQKLTTGHSLMTTFCSDVGNWVPEIPECVGKGPYYSYVFLWQTL